MTILVGKQWQCASHKAMPEVAAKARAWRESLCP